MHVLACKDLLPLCVCVFFLLAIFEQTCSLSLWGGVLSAEFVWFKAQGSY